MISSSTSQLKPIRNSSIGYSVFVIFVTAVLSIGIGYVFVGCDAPLSIPAEDGMVYPDGADRVGSLQLSNAISRAELNRQLAAVRNLTAPYHSFDAGFDAGWAVQLSGCVEHPFDQSIGNMGYHYGNPEYLGDGIEDLDVLRPQVLMYEPQKNGKYHLTGVEYIILFDIHPSDAAPPVLFGQEFVQNPVLGLWALHVWVWRHNPNGMFHDWNPRVSCKYD
jgi:hypothetical protein